MKQQFLVDIAGTIRLTAYENNTAQVPTSGNIVLKKPGGSTLQASTAVTVNSTTGEMTYALTTTHTDLKGLNYIAEWDYLIGSETYYTTQLFDIVRSKLSIPITDDDVYDELGSLRKTAKQDSSTATSASASTVVDTAERKEVDDFWNGGTIEIISGTGANQIRNITDFVQSTATITVSPDWTTTPDSTSKYVIIRSLTNKIKNAFEKFEKMLYDKGKRHQLILESSQIKFPLIYLVIHNLCLDLVSEVDDKWDILQKEYKDKFNDAFNNMVVDYDLDDSKTIEGVVESQFSPTEIRIQRS